MISLIIPTVSKTREYTNNILNNIRAIYPNKNEVEIIVEENDNVDLGTNYNNAVTKATSEKIILLHNDMVIKPGFIETMDKHITKGRITTYTRIEPPIFPDTYPGKVLLDCGSDIDNFNSKKFNEFDIEEDLINGGSQLFFGCLKEDYLKLDNITFSPPQMWCSDDDLHLRYKLAGFEHKVSSAYVYHFVSKTSRSTSDYQVIEQQSNINFIKKWGFRNSIHNVVYKKSIKITNSNPQLEQVLNPWFNEGQDIIVEVNGNTFTQEDFNVIQQLNDIIKEDGEIGSFELGNLKITINSMNEYQNDLIKL
jgi:GT2 family glycosyltransferase